MNNFLLTVLVLGIAAAGCGRERSTSPVPQVRSWDQLVLAEAPDETGAPFSELQVQSDGALTFQIRRGSASSSRGLLAGDKLETLTRLVDALPPVSYSPARACPDRAFILTVTVGGATRFFASDSCDTETPASVTAVRSFASRLVTSTVNPRPVVVVPQVLLAGSRSALHRPLRLILEDRDALARLLREHSPDQPIAIPRVDFSSKFVVAEWLGDQPSSGYEIDLVAGITAAGWYRLEFARYVPGLNCDVASVVTQPFVLAAFDRHPEPFLFQDSIEEVNCLSPAPGRGGK
jgi:hypothetical protein